MGTLCHPAKVAKKYVNITYWHVHLPIKDRHHAKLYRAPVFEGGLILSATVAKLPFTRLFRGTTITDVIFMSEKA